MNLQRKDYIPAYLRLFKEKPLEFTRRIEEAWSLANPCRMCPRVCGVNRRDDETGICCTGRHARLSHAFPHHGEESCLSGNRGSGTLFFSCCSLKCVFCQNFDLSWQGYGFDREAAEIARCMIELQNRRCHNINLVTPGHVIPQILEALELAVKQGLCLPLVYNSSGYDSMESLRLMDGIVDIYMPDFKFWHAQQARLYMDAEDYPQVARTAIKEMHRQTGPLCLDEQGIALRGVLVRHLVMPADTAGSRHIFRFISREVSPDTWVNIMSQYRPEGHVLKDSGKYPLISRTVTSQEYIHAVAAAREEGLFRLEHRL